MKKLLFCTLIGLFMAYVLMCTILYFYQEKLLFRPDKLDKNYQFSFQQPFEEINVTTKKGTLLNGLLFKADNPKGLVFYLHGNSGAVDQWGRVAKRYTSLQYDVFILDYPGFGKSEGAITSQAELYADIQSAYNTMKKRYTEEEIVVIGYSIGSGLAAKLAATNAPRLLILQAPYYSMTDMMHRIYPIIPDFLLKYKLATNQYVKECKMPVVVFHGNQDEVIYYGSSLKLKAEMKPKDTLITLNKQGHDDITYNADYIKAIGRILY